MTRIRTCRSPSESFRGAEDLAEQMRDAGFSSVEFERLTFGAVALHLGKKESSVRPAGAP